MSERDMLIIERLKNAFEGSNNSVGYLTQAIIGEYMGVKTSTFSDGLKKREDYISQRMLSSFYRRSKESNSTRSQRLASVALDIFLEEQSKLLGITKAEICNAINNNPGILFKTASSATIMLSAQSNISIDLPDICSRSSKIKILNLIINKDAVAQNIKAIEVWAYGRDGNYSRQLYLNIFQRDYEPIAEMVGGFIEGEFHAYIKHDEGYFPMSQIGHELLLEEENNLSNEQPAWSLPHSPEARIIERLLRELKEEKGFPVEALDFLVNEAAAYEDTKPTSKDQDVSPWEVLSNSLISKMKCHKNKVVADKADTVKDTLFGLRVLDL